MNDVALRLEAIEYAKEQGYTVPDMLKAKPRARAIKKTFARDCRMSSEARFIAELASIDKGDTLYHAAIIPIERDCKYTLMLYLKGGATVGFINVHHEEKEGKVTKVKVWWKATPDFDKGLPKKLVRDHFKQFDDDEYASELVWNCIDHLHHVEFDENLDDVSEYAEHIDIQYINHDIFGDLVTGDSYLYIYTYPSFIELYGAGVRDTLTLKIGKTKYGKSPTERIYEQVRKSGITSQPEKPIILCYKVYTNSVKNLETSIQKDLAEYNCKKGKLTGIEWFEVTPEVLSEVLYKHECILNIEPAYNVVNTWAVDSKNLRLEDNVSRRRRLPTPAERNDILIASIEKTMKFEEKFASYIWLFKLGREIHWKYYSDIEKNPDITFNEELYEELGLKGEYSYYESLTKFYKTMVEHLVQEIMIPEIKEGLTRKGILR